MKLSKKALLVLFVFAVLLVPLGQLSAVHSDLPLPQTLEAKALACLTDVYPVDLNHYNVTLGAYHTFPPAPPDMPFEEEAVIYTLNSPDSNLEASFLFRDGVLFTSELWVINGSVVTARSYANLTDAARDFLLKYQVFSGANSTELIRLLGNFSEAQYTTVTLGNISLSVHHSVILRLNVGNVTHFGWSYTLNGTSGCSVGLTVDKSTVYKLYDGRQFYKVGSAEAISAAMKYVENYSYTAPDGAQVSGFNVHKDGTVAEFSASPRNGSAMYPCWDVTLNLNQTYPGGVNAFLVEVWADSGEVFNCRNQAVGSVQVDDPNMYSTLIGTATAIAAVTIAVVIIVMRRRK